MANRKVGIFITKASYTVCYIIAVNLLYSQSPSLVIAAYTNLGYELCKMCTYRLVLV